ncbi:MAG: hypothetical protein RR573_02940 [Oscillospiraceae bacterium]
MKKILSVFVFLSLIFSSCSSVPKSSAPSISSIPNSSPASTSASAPKSDLTLPPNVNPVQYETATALAKAINSHISADINSFFAEQMYSGGIGTLEYIDLFGGAAKVLSNGPSDAPIVLSTHLGAPFTDKWHDIDYILYFTADGKQINDMIPREYVENIPDNAAVQAIRDFRAWVLTNSFTSAEDIRKDQYTAIYLLNCAKKELGEYSATSPIMQELALKHLGLANYKSDKFWDETAQKYVLPGMGGITHPNRSLITAYDESEDKSTVTVQSYIDRFYSIPMTKQIYTLNKNTDGSYKILSCDISFFDYLHFDNIETDARFGATASENGWLNGKAFSYGEDLFPTAMPNLNGLTIAEINNALSERNLSADAIIYISSEKPQDTFLYTAVPTDSVIPRGTAIDIYVSSGNLEDKFGTYVPAFLSPEQADLYLRGIELYTHYSVSLGFDIDSESFANPINKNGKDYYLDKGYKSFAELRQNMESVFTKEYTQTLFAGTDGPFYIAPFGEDGALYSVMGDRGGNILFAFESFELVSKTDAQIKFNRIGYYGAFPGDPPALLTTKAFPIVFKNTANGWRIDLFNTVY